MSIIGSIFKKKKKKLSAPFCNGNTIIRHVWRRKICYSWRHFLGNLLFTLVLRGKLLSTLSASVPIIQFSYILWEKRLSVVIFWGKCFIRIVFFCKKIIRSSFLTKVNYPQLFQFKKKKHFLSLSALFSVKKIFIRINFATFSLWESIIAIFCAANTPRIKNPHHIL